MFNLPETSKFADALSLPEIIILKKVLKLPLILTFVGIVTVGIVLVGYLRNWVF